ncbi:hypothetical protein ACHAXH_001072 [Discostella pseudostelligera]
MKQRRRHSTSIDAAANGTNNGKMAEDINLRRRQRRPELRGVQLHYFYFSRASLGFGLFLLLAGISTQRRLTQPKGAAATVNDDGESLYELTADDSTPVLCSSELNAYCPPKTRCCPRYHHEKQPYSSRQLFAVKDGRDNSLIALSIVGYTCLPSSSAHSPPSVCCADEHVGDSSTLAHVATGCAAGYSCAAPIPTIDSNTLGEKADTTSLMHTPYCVRDDASTTLIDLRGHPINNTYEQMPRYRTCPAFAMQDVITPYGLPIPASAANYHNLVESSENKSSSGGIDGNFIGQLAYFTNMGPIVTTTTTSAPSPNSSAKTAVIAIHGSGRDALSYLCAIIAAVADISQHAPVFDSSKVLSTIGRRRLRVQKEMRTTTSEKGDILTIAPWFLAPADGRPKSSSDLPFLQWTDDSPVEHSFRYGAESMEVPIVSDDGNSPKMSTISSFAALDVLLETLCDKANYPRLERIVVVGHSAGGQVVHRWGVTSDSWCFGDGDEGGHPTADLPSIRLVAANPRSYAYLDTRRYFPTSSFSEDAVILGDQGVGGKDTLSPFDKLDFRLPTESELDDCPEYDRYIWGLEDNPRVPAPYITSHVQKFMASGVDGRTKIFCRYASRDVVYLSGERDTEKLGNQIVDGDGYQGPSRRERSERFFLALQVQGAEKHICNWGRGYIKGGLRAQPDVGDDEKIQVHSRMVVENVGHDHTLIFQSPEGLSSMFSGPTM